MLSSTTDFKMFKLASLAMMPLVPSAQAATFPDRQPSQINRVIFAQKLVPIKKSSKLKTTVILTTPVDATRARKVELSPADRVNQQKADCQREMSAGASIGANERAVGLSGSASNATDRSNQPDPLPNFHNTATGNCNFLGKF
jgi:hypothetical protein